MLLIKHFKEKLKARKLKNNYKKEDIDIKIKLQNNLNSVLDEYFPKNNSIQIEIEKRHIPYFWDIVESINLTSGYDIKQEGVLFTIREKEL